MNDCRTVEMLLPLFRDGELDTRASDRVRAHVARCAHCAALLRDLRTVDGALAGERAVTPPLHEAERFDDEVMRRLSASPPGVSSALPLRLRAAQRIAALSAALRPGLSAAFLALCALFLWQEVRDASKLAALEHALRWPSDGIAAPGASPERDVAYADRLLARVASAPAPLLPTIAMECASSLRRLLVSRGDRLPRSGDTLAVAFARRYPALAALSAGTELDAPDRIAGEGRIFARHLRTLLRHERYEP